MPILSDPFEQVGINIVDPLIQLTSKHKFLLILVDYSSRYPETFTT